MPTVPARIGTTERDCRDSDRLKSWNQNDLTIGRDEEILAADKRGWAPIRKNRLVLSALIGVYRRLTCLLFAIPPSASTGARRDFLETVAQSDSSGRQ